MTTTSTTFVPANQPRLRGIIGKACAPPKPVVSPCARMTEMPGGRGRIDPEGQTGRHVPSLRRMNRLRLLRSLCACTGVYRRARL